MSTSITTVDQLLFRAGIGSGHKLVPGTTPLTSLNFFDGKFLRAADFKVEQRYVDALVRYSNMAEGPGVVHGLEVELASGDDLQVAAGLAIDPSGRVLLLPSAETVDIADLIRRSRRQAIPLALRPLSIRLRRGLPVFDECEPTDREPVVETLEGRRFYVITVAHADALCGREDVYGRLCENACDRDTARPFRNEGVVVRARPLDLTAFLPGSSAVTFTRGHLRSLIASAYFASERARMDGSLVSGAGLRSAGWCNGAEYLSEPDVPLGLLCREGDTTLFLDVWTARRERMESSPRRYWAGRMAMRPWNVFLAQVLQFQCQLRSALGAAPDPGRRDDGPCADEREALEEARRALEELRDRMLADPERHLGAALDLRPEVLRAAARPAVMRHILSSVEPTAEDLAAALREEGATEATPELTARVLSAVRPIREVIRFDDRFRDLLDQIRRRPRTRALLRGGIVELPSAGYLPVTPGSSVSVNRQVRELMGEGVDLRFCIVRPDFVPHALEEAQHMERISLTQGLDDPKRRPEVDVLVPNGRARTRQVEAPGRGYETSLTLHSLRLPPLKWAGALPGLQPVAGLTAHRSMTGGLFGLGDAVADAAAEIEDAAREAAEAAAGGAEPPGGSAASPSPEQPTTFHGAARSERLDSGGSAFHFAGLARRRVKPIGTRPEVAERLGDLFPLGHAEISEIRSRVVEDVEPAVTTSRHEARAAYDLHQPFLSRREILDAIDAPRIVFDPGKTPTAPAVFESSAVWLSVRVGDDPLRLPRHGTVQVQGELLLVAASNGSDHTTSLRLGATLQITERSRMEDGGRRVRGHLSGSVTVSRRAAWLPGKNAILTPSFELDEEVVLERTRDQDGRLLTTVSLPKAEFWAHVPARTGARGGALQSAPGEIEVKSAIHTRRLRTREAAEIGDVAASIRDITAAPAGRAAARGLFELPDDIGISDRIDLPDNLRLPLLGLLSLPLFQGSLREDPGVLRPGHRAHDASVASIRRVGQALRDARFADRASQALFPPPRPVEDELVLDAVEDWVLFHRRRSKVCHEEAAPPTPVPSRQYRLYHVRVPSEELPRLRQELEAGVGSLLARLDPQPLMNVEFAPGTQSLLTSREALTARWQERVEAAGAEMVLGAIASHGAAREEGEALARARLGQLAQVLGAVTPLDDAATLLHLDQVTAPLFGGDLDGIVLLATETTVQLCQEVYRLLGDEADVKTLTGRAAASRAPIGGLLTELGAVRLTQVRFREGAPDAIVQGGEALISRWQEEGGGAVREAIVLAKGGEAEAQKSQARTVASQVGGQVDPTRVSLKADLPPCNVATLLVVSPTVCHAGYLMGLMRPGYIAAMPLATLRKITDTIGQTGFPETFTDHAVHLGNALFTKGTAEATQETLAAQKAQWDSLVVPSAVRVPAEFHALVVSAPGTSQTRHEAHLRQGRKLLENVGGNGDVLGAIAGGEAFPTNCPALTMFIAVSTADDFENVAVTVRAAVGAHGHETEFALRFEDDGKLIKDERYHAAVARLKEEGAKFDEVDLLGARKPRATDRRLRFLYEALKEEGLLTADSKKKTGRLEGEEREILDRGGLNVPNVFSLRRVDR